MVRDQGLTELGRWAFARGLPMPYSQNSSDSPEISKSMQTLALPHGVLGVPISFLLLLLKLGEMRN